MNEMWEWHKIDFYSYDGLRDLSLFSICGIIRGINSSLENCLDIKKGKEEQVRELRETIKELKRFIENEEEIIRKQETKCKEEVKKFRRFTGKNGEGVEIMAVNGKNLLDKLGKCGDELKRRKERLEKQKKELKEMEELKKEQKKELNSGEIRIMDEYWWLMKNKISIFRFIDEIYELWLWWLVNFSRSFFKFYANESELIIEFWDDKTDKIQKIVINSEGCVDCSSISTSDDI